MSQSHHTKAHALVVLAQCCYSGWYILGSVALSGGTADPLLFELYRDCLATILMCTFVYIQGHSFRINREDLPRFVFLGFCSFVNVVGTVVALKFVSATKYSILQPSIPVWGTIISAVFGYEWLTTTKTFGIVLAVCGAVLMERQTPTSGDNSTGEAMFGTFLVTAQCVAMACLLVFQQPMVMRYPSATVTLTYYGIGTGFTILAYLSQSQKYSYSDYTFHDDAFSWMALGYVSIFTTLFAYNALAWAVGHLSPGIVTLYCTLQPVGTALLSFILWGRLPSYSEATGGALVALGLLISVKCRQAAPNKSVITFMTPLRSRGEI